MGKGPCRRRSGITLTIVLLVITLMIVILSVVVRQGLGSLHQAKLATASKQALFAAEAGAAVAFRQLVADSTFGGPVPLTSMGNGATFSVHVTNNIASTGGDLFAPNGAKVPVGFAYIYATGRPGPQGVSRSVGVLVSPGSASALSMVIGVGGRVTMGGSKDITGTIKANGDIDFQGSTTITPINNSGRVLSSGSVGGGGNIRMDEAQDVRARVSISAPINGPPPELIVSPDVSNSTLPFIADGRTTNALLAGEEGEVLPNPDPNVLLAAAVTHYSDPTVSPAPAPYAGPYPAPNGAMVNVGGTLDLAGQVHYFPGGVSFSGSSAVVGAGTIVTGYGNPMTFQGSTTVDGNLIALASDPTVASNASITFQGSSDVKGLIYAHEDITFQGSFNLEGLVIAYRNGGGDLTTQGSTDITLDSTVLSDIPGFEAWANGFGGVGGIPGGSGPISARSWERQ